jgi:hypothetical protein
MEAPAWVIQGSEVFIVILGPMEEQDMKLMRAIPDPGMPKQVEFWD